ncbi:uncharacterized protein LOC128891950 [Hylaeus anthracinus]|uniref:uncharacterized protein LOC128891950 n=1 Tax=Hylaeus anthracinus TaxID=313031 RepID=UPI0023B9D34F|nr:uncharacterized protein LOC128891950 [Hylaeus anthracinus]
MTKYVPDENVQVLSKMAPVSKSDMERPRSGSASYAPAICRGDACFRLCEGVLARYSPQWRGSKEPSVKSSRVSRRYQLRNWSVRRRHFRFSTSGVGKLWSAGQIQPITVEQMLFLNKESGEIHKYLDLFVDNQCQSYGMKVSMVVFTLFRTNRNQLNK